MKRLASYSLVLVSLLIGISILSTVTLAQGDWRQIPIVRCAPFNRSSPNEFNCRMAW